MTENQIEKRGETVPRQSLTKDQLGVLAQANEVREGGSPDALLGTMMTMLANRGGALLPTEEEQFVPLMQTVMARAEELVRAKLAHQVAGLACAPRGLYEFLAHDTIEVARPLLVECDALSDDFLIEVVQEESPEHAKAIAARQHVSTHVSAAIVGTGAEDTILLLLKNPGAEIAPSSFAEITIGAGDKPNLQHALVAREDLPAVVAQQLFWNAGTGLRKQILERFPIEPTQVDALLKDAVAESITDPLALEIREGLRHMTETTSGGVRLSVSEIIGFIKADRLDDFVRGVSVRLGIRHSSVKKILCDQGGEALAVLCRALFADRTQFTSVLLQNDYQRFGTPRPTGQIEQISKIYDQVQPERAIATVQMWDALDPRAVA